MASNRNETLKTIAGILVIAVIVTATFLYGNKQRQDQLKNEQAKTQGDQSQQNVTSGTEPNVTVNPTQSGVDVNSLDNQGQGSSKAQSPQTGSLTTPETGAAEGLIPLALLVGGGAYYRHSRKSLKTALRS